MITPQVQTVTGDIRALEQRIRALELRVNDLLAVQDANIHGGAVVVATSTHRSTAHVLATLGDGTVVKLAICT